MGFLAGFLCGLLFIPLSILAGLYYFFTYSESYAEKRQELLEEQQRKNQENELDLDMSSTLYASYLAARQQNAGNGQGLPGIGSIPEHLDPQYQFAGWISVKRIPEVDHRIIEPSAKDTKKLATKSGQPKGSSYSLSVLEDGVHGRGVAGSLGAGAAAQDSRFTYLDTQNPHLSLPPSLQARFKDSKYGVIRGATMFIYENEYTQECLGIITLPNYKVSVPGNQDDSHIWSKRNPIWLQYQPNNQTRRSTESDSSISSSKDYYLSMVNCVDKEDLYFTLLRCSKIKLNNPRPFLREIPKRDSTMFDKSAMNTLIRTIHSDEHQFQAAWLNALLGRMFLGVYKTPQVKESVFQKLVEKLSRVKLPNILNDIRMKSVHLGDGVPMFTRPKLLSLKPNGDLTMDMNLLYQGGFRVEVEAEAVVTVTKGIRPIKVPLVLVVTLVRLEGRLQAWIKPPPCNRIWYGFYHKPHVELKIEPVVSDKHIKSSLIIKAIENKMLEAIAETMVLPNMDDIPFSDTDGVGGIFGEEILPGGETAATAQQEAAKARPKRSYSPATRSATINIAEVTTGNPRAALDFSGDTRNRAETIAVPEIYQNAAGSRSFGSLGDEVLQTNYTYDSHNGSAAVTDDDPMRNGVHRPRSSTDSADGLRSRSIRSGMDQGSKMQTNGVATTVQSSGLLQRRNPGSSMEPIRGRSGSVDRHAAVSYTTGSSIGGQHTPTFPAMDNGSSTTEHNWSHYGISEYDPSAPLQAKDKKKQKEKAKAPEKDGDHMSVHSRDSGDTASTHTGNTENTGQSSSSSFFGYINGSAVDSSSSRSEKFSLTRMFQGFRRKHTKNSPSGSGLSTSQSNTNVVVEDENEQDENSVVITDDDGFVDSESPPYNNSLEASVPAPSSSSSSSTQHLSCAYQPYHRKKFESTPNLSSSLYSNDAQETLVDSGLGTDSARSTQDDLDLLKKAGSPPPSVYAASIFGVEDGNGQGRMAPGVTTFPKFGAALLKLRSRSRAGSGSSREELSIPSVPPGELNAALVEQQLLQQQQQKTGSDSSSQLSVQTDGFDLYSFNAVVEDHQTSDTSVGQQQSTSQVQGFAAAATSTTAPIIVLQKASPYLGHGELPFAEGYSGRASLDESRFQQAQGNPNGMRLDQRASSPGVNGRSESPKSRPRRHSINHPPSSPSAAYNAGHPYYALAAAQPSSYGLGVNPASPLRKEFPREEDEDEDENHRDRTKFGSSDTSHGKLRRNSDAFSLASTATSSSRSTTSKDSHQPNHPNSHSSALRHFLSSFGGKHKKKPTHMEPANYGMQQEDPYTGTVGMVGMVGVVSTHRTSVSNNGLQDDPFAYQGGLDDEHGTHRRPRDEQEHTRTFDMSTTTQQLPLEDTHHHHHHHHHHHATTERSLHVGVEVSSLETLLDSPSLSPAQSIKGKAIAITLDANEEVHARPGYIGEYPTPVRLHSMLNREAAAVRALIEKTANHDDVEGGNNGYDEMEKQEQDVILNGGHDYQDPLYGSTGGPGGNSSLPDPDFSPALPLDAGPLTVKSPSMSMEEPGPFSEPGAPVELPREETLMIMPPTPVSGKTLVDHGLSMESLDNPRQLQEDVKNGQEQFNSLPPGTNSGQTMTRYDYDYLVMKTTTTTTVIPGDPQPLAYDAPLPPTPSPPLLSDEPSPQDIGHDQTKVLVDEEGNSICYDNEAADSEAVEDNESLQPTLVASHPCHAGPGTKKSHHRNIFRRLIRRKSEDTLHPLHGTTKQDQQQLYLNPVSSKSYSSIPSTSSSSFLHRHHHHQQSKQQLHPDELSSSTLLPKTESVQTRASEDAKGEKKDKGEIHPQASPVPERLAKVRTRPRSSTFHVFSTSRY